MSKTSTKKTATLNSRQKLQQYALKQASASNKGWRVTAKGDELIIRR